jgi:hypothetical protein
MCACTETDVRESANDCTLASGEGHRSHGGTFLSLYAASPVSSFAERTVASHERKEILSSMYCVFYVYRQYSEVDV